MATDDFSGIDLERYRNELEELSLTPEQETELLGVLFSMMKTFVELGFSLEGCGQLLGAFEEAASLDGNRVPLINATTLEGTPHRENPL